jgi:glycosyltransferase involved in cell wall biosynthesis
MLSDKRRIFFVVNVDWFFISHRLPLALEGMKRGYDVFVLTKDTGRRSEIEANGIIFIEINFERSGTNPISEFNILIQLYKIYKKYRPYLVHHVTIKPAIYGTMVLRAFNLKNIKVVNAISGLGFNFTAERKTHLQRAILIMMKYSFKYSKSNFIFQNPDDLEFYNQLGFIRKDNFVIVSGSGVDENQLQYSPPKVSEKITVLLNARMLYDKGIVEFCTAARKIENRWRNKAVFLLVGDIDSENPTSATKNELVGLLSPGYIVWKGFSKDISSVISDADIICLPSYREGLPKSLVEAMAIGRPIITTDTPGCRECVIEGVNGYLVPVKDSVFLAQRIEELLLNVNLRIKMGLFSRQLMIKNMSLSKVIKSTFDFYEAIE